ncbi:uncharacterized protein BDR25DRAFT_359036 [Lindgomyces ingoldianus]|uniref:Uncharacterized protein n=1 Tax=Lindgomyces ingoldianus TaxID=673940 RepID=A0ACB6QJD6_9PLEO|nr:uncharacterized protein BDR25DRAFT_359036 [Lindgomyces ingoldianus]KAF2466982.1 hypothetical protein BDR25DRAFT_359036 [Lindgomyces ingoldianus]
MRGQASRDTEELIMRGPRDAAYVGVQMTESPCPRSQELKTLTGWLSGQKAVGLLGRRLLCGESKPVNGVRNGATVQWPPAMLSQKEAASDITPVSLGNGKLRSIRHTSRKSTSAREGHTRSEKLAAGYLLADMTDHMHAHKYTYCIYCSPSSGYLGPGNIPCFSIHKSSRANLQAHAFAYAPTVKRKGTAMVPMLVIDRSIASHPSKFSESFVLICLPANSESTLSLSHGVRVAAPAFKS